MKVCNSGETFVLFRQSVTQQAVRGMVDFLVRERGMQPYDAYTLCSLAGDVRVSRTFRPISPVKMMLSRKALEQVG